MSAQKSVLLVPASPARDLLVSRIYHHICDGSRVVIALPSSFPNAKQRGLRDELILAGLAPPTFDFIRVDGERAARAAATKLGASIEVASPPTPQKLTRVVLLGHGTVGVGVYTRLASESNRFFVVGCAVRNPKKHRLPRDILPHDVNAIASIPADLLVSLIGGIEPARSLIFRALERGQSVVTANKAVVAAYGRELRATAQATGARFEYSAAVGGSVPVLETIDRLRRVAPIRRVRGLLSGTANYVLTQVAAGQPFDQAVSSAQKQGLAEKDPTRDLDGTDTAEKLAVIAAHAFDESLSVESISTDGIGDSLRGQNLGLVATLERRDGKLVGRVVPEELEPGDPLRGADGPENRVLIESASGERTLLCGLGAGRWPTTASVFADIERVADVEAVR